MLSLHGALENMHRLYLSQCIVADIILKKEKVVDLSHAWFLLRLLFIFLMACPFLIVPALLSLRRKQPEAQDRTEARADQSTRLAVSGLGTWNRQADSLSQLLHEEAAASTTEKRAA
jgi:hypothetical protein